MSDDEDKDDIESHHGRGKKKSAIDIVRDALFKKPLVKITSGDEEDKDGETQEDETQTEQEDQKVSPKIVAVEDENEEEKEGQEEKGRERRRDDDESDRTGENKVLRLIPERLRGNDGIVDVLEELLEYAAEGRLSYLTIAYGVDKGFGKVDSKAAWRVRDPGDHESARDIIFALEQLKYMCLKEWTEIERI